MSVSKKEERKGQTDYSKKHACIFCGKLDYKIARHLCKKHANEKEIAQLPPYNRKGKISQSERKRTLDILRNEGDFLYNVDILKDGDKMGSGLIVAKRPQAGEHQPKDYLPCKYCLRFYIKSELWRHSQRCQFNPESSLIEEVSEDTEEKESRRFMKHCALLLYGAGVRTKVITDKDKEDFHFYIISSLQDDKIGKSLKADRGIVNYGRNEYERLGRRRANEVRYRMRLLERVKQEVVSLGEKKSDLALLLLPEKYELFVQAVRNLSGISNERSLNGVIMFEKPQLARKTGQILRKFADMAEGEAIAERDKTKRTDISDFLCLYDKTWSAKIGSLAHQTSVEKKFNKKQMLPVTEDVQKLQKHLDTAIEEECKELASEPSKKKWKAFAYLLLTKVTLFNFRRGNEVAAMQVKKFQERYDWKTGNQEIYKSLTGFEQELAKRMDLVEVMGKHNNKVPCLLTPATRAGIEQLINLRCRCSINAENPYVFAKGSRSFIPGNDALKEVLENVPDLQHSEALRFPTMRKYLATVVQVFGMKENDVKEVARHMGHELEVHRKFYRLQDDVIELAKISKLLLAVENGQAHQFKGMSLDDLDLQDFPDQEIDPVEEITMPGTLDWTEPPLGSNNPPQGPNLPPLRGNNPVLEGNSPALAGSNPPLGGNNEPPSFPPGSSGSETGVQDQFQPLSRSRPISGNIQNGNSNPGNLINNSPISQGNSSMTPNKAPISQSTPLSQQHMTNIPPQNGPISSLKGQMPRNMKQSVTGGSGFDSSVASDFSALNLPVLPTKKGGGPHGPNPSMMTDFISSKLSHSSSSPPGSQPAIPATSSSHLGGSDSESDLEWDAEIKKRKRLTGEKKKWSVEEKEVLKPLVSLCIRKGKPPQKEEILSVQKKTVLTSIPWVKIKHQAWAMSQSEVKKRKKVLKGFNLE